MKRVKFPLAMKNGVMVRTLEELRENYDAESLISSYMDGRLKEWLSMRYYEIECSEIESLDINSADFINELYRILKLPVGSLKEDTSILVHRANARKNLKKYTDDEYFFMNLDYIAFNQEELSKLIDAGEKIIYLCGDIFEIPMSYQNVKYIGINNPSIIVKDLFAKEHYENNGIQFENLSVKVNEADTTITSEQLLAVHSLRRDPFEYVEEYDKRINEMEAICCGVVFLDKKDYVIEQKKFKVSIEWYKGFLCEIRIPLPQNGFSMNLERDIAKRLYYSGACHRVYIKFRSINGRLLIENIFLHEQDDVFMIDYQWTRRSSEHMTFSEISSGIGGYGIQLI